MRNLSVDTTILGPHQQVYENQVWISQMEVDF